MYQQAFQMFLLHPQVSHIQVVGSVIIQVAMQQVELSQALVHQPEDFQVIFQNIFSIIGIFDYYR